MVKEPVRVLFCCTGVGIFNRGIETFFREAFDGLKDAEGIEARLIKGAEDRGQRAEDGSPKAEDSEQTSVLDSRLSTLDSCARERAVWCLKRTGWLAPLLGKLTGRNAYAVEQWSSVPGVVRVIRRFRPHVVFTSEANLMFLLRRFRRRIGVPFRVLYSNGGPVHPPFNRHDVVHQVAPFYRDEALAAGESPEKHFLVPYGIHVPSTPNPDPAAKCALRERLGLPVDRPVILSVGWIARQHKRMDYVVREVVRVVEMQRTEGGGRKAEKQGAGSREQTAESSPHQAARSKLPAPSSTPFLQLLGAMDQHSPEIIELGMQKLGVENFAAKSVPPDQVADYYRAADIFVLGSLAEGFGRVYLEALMHGLPTIGHRHPVIEYVLGDAGILADLAKEGALAAALLRELRRQRTEDGSQKADDGDPVSGLGPQASPSARWDSVRSRFSWDVLRPHYVEMFRRAAEAEIPED